MAAVGTPSDLGTHLAYTGIAGTGDNAVVIETGDISKYKTFSLSSTGGAMDVFVSVDGSSFLANPLSLEDFSGVGGVPVLVTAAGGLYQTRAQVRKIRVMQNGGTAVANAVLLCWVA